MARLAMPADRHATFREEKTYAALSTPLASWGSLSFHRPSHVEKDTTAPAAERLVLDGTRLVIIAGQDAPRVVDLQVAPELLALVDTMRGTLAGDLPALRRSFTVRVSGSLAAWRMELSPANDRIGKLVASVVVDGVGADPLRILTTQPNGDTDRLDITPDR